MLKRFQLMQTNRPIDVVLFWRSDGYLELNPPYQRGDVWGTKRRVNLIRSVLMGVPIPSIIVNNRLKGAEGDEPSDFRCSDDWQYAVIDGKQRLTTILMFLDSRLEIPTEWIEPNHIEGKVGKSIRYSDFTQAGRLRFKNQSMAFSEGSLRTLDDEHEVFDLVNFGGLKQGERDD